jgi:hypothetical protein
MAMAIPLSRSPNVNNWDAVIGYLLNEPGSGLYDV